MRFVGGPKDGWEYEPKANRFLVPQMELKEGYRISTEDFMLIESDGWISDWRTAEDEPIIWYVNHVYVRDGDHMTYRGIE